MTFERIQSSVVAATKNLVTHFVVFRQRFTVNEFFEHLRKISFKFLCTTAGCYSLDGGYDLERGMSLCLADRHRFTTA